MKPYLTLLLAALALLPACGVFQKRLPMMTTTTTAAGPHAFGAAAGEGGVTTTVSKPYNPFVEDAGAAGKSMFSRP